MLVEGRTGEAVVARDEVLLRASRIPAETWILLAATAVGAVLRFATLGTQSYWFDEAQAAHELHMGFGAMLSSWSTSEPNPPLYFVLAWPWAKLFGTSEVGLRSLSALLGTAMIPISYRCAEQMISRRAAALVAAFVAVSPFMIWYSQEAREYMLLAVLCGGSLLFFARVWQGGGAADIRWWTLLSALALLTQYFAAFLVAAEALLLLYRGRRRPVVVAVIVLGAVELALLPHAISHASHPAAWIAGFPLAVRIRQVPVAFALGTLYQSSAVNYGLLGAAALAACMIVLLVVGAGGRALRAAGLAAALAGVVLLVPLLVALLGHDYYEARALMPAWLPLAVVLAAACAGVRARAGGAVLALVALGAFVYADVRISADAVYQRPDWRGVAQALGTPSSTRAIVAYDGTFASAPLAIYLPGVAWSGHGQIPQTSQAPVSIGELDIVGSVWQSTPRTLPRGTRVIASSAVDGYLVRRFALGGSWRAAPAEIAARAARLLGPAPAGAAVLVQRAT